MVYFGSVSDDTLKKFTSTVNVNKSYSVEEISLSNYWSVEDVDGVLRAIPLFHTEEITSSNRNDNVLNTNKCLICEDEEDTVIYCRGSANPTVNSTSFVLYAYTIDLETIYCIVTDKYNNIIPGAKIEVYKDNTSIAEVKTNNDGICKYQTSTSGGYKFVLDGFSSNNVVII